MGGKGFFGGFCGDMETYQSVNWLSLMETHFQAYDTDKQRTREKIHKEINS